MKFSCKTSDLLQALSLVSRAISAQQALPILQNVLIKAEGKQCQLSATDLELSIITSFEAAIENEGTITVPAKALLNFAQYNSDTDILLETSEGTQLKCTSTSAKTTIAGEDAGEYPTITPVDREKTLTLQSGDLLLGLQHVTYASAKTTLRPVLAGVYVQTKKGELTMAATDSYRLSEYTLKTDGVTDDIECIVPSKVLDELKGVISSARSDAPKGKEDEGTEAMSLDVQVLLSSQQVEFSIGNTRLLSRLIEGKFPDYKQIIPDKENTKAVVSTKELLTAAKRMHYFAKEVNNNLTFEFKKNKLHITTPPTQAGKDEAELDVDMTGDDNKIALSSSYILDYLGRTEEDVVVLHLTDSLHPAVFTTAATEDALHLIMPLRLQEEN